MLEESVAQAAQQIQMTIDALRTIADSKLPGLKDDASHSRDRFRNLHLGDGAFSDFPEAQVVARQYTGTHEVFVDTISGVIADLQDFEQRLRDSVASAEATDEQVEASLVALGQRLSHGYTFAADKSYRASNRAHAADLHAGESHGHPGAGEPNADTEPVSNEQAPASTPTDSPTAGETF